MSDFRLNVNGREHRVSADGEETLLSVLRNRLDLTGTKYGCGEGECGACTVLMDDAPKRACLVKMGSIGGAKITTIEGLGRDGALSPVQQAFLDEEAMQCAYCTPGLIVSATALLKEHPKPTDEQMVAFMEGNICRCGDYPRILAAIRRASKTVESGRQA